MPTPFGPMRMSTKSELSGLWVLLGFRPGQASLV
jgi:hypothetical protein